jgi:hypothetical protein
MSGVLLFLPKLVLLYRVPVLPSILVLLARTLVLLYKALVDPPSSYRQEAGRRQAGGRQEAGRRQALKL